MAQTPLIIAVEEHVAVSDLSALLDRDALFARGWPSPGHLPALLANSGPEISEYGERRLAAMDAAGIAVQILSYGGPTAELVSGGGSAAYARSCNDRLAQIVAVHPDRFRAFAYLPGDRPAEAADELQRSVEELGFCGALISGTTNGLFLDSPYLAPLLDRAQRLAVPIFLHPGLPPPAVQSAYYSGLPGNMGFILGSYGWGWHSEVAVHALRLVVSGALDRYPDLQFIIGHMGEGLPAMMERIDESFAPEASHLVRLPSDYLKRHFHVAISGFVSPGGFDTLLATMGEDRVLFAADYPMTDHDAAIEFFRSRTISDLAREKIGWRNAGRLFNIVVR